MQRGREKRRYLRIPVEVNFYVDDRSHGEIGQIYFESRNVSEGGAFLASDFLMQVGTQITVRFQLPGEPVIDAQGFIAWVSEADEVEPGMGIEFTALSEAGELSLRRFLKRALREGTPTT